MEDASSEPLNVSDVNPALIFEAYFGGAPPFDSTKKKNEFPDAFSLRRLALWAEQNAALVYVLGPDPDLKRICEATPQFRHFEKTEILLDYLNRGDRIVRKLKERPKRVIRTLLDYVLREFPNLSFELEYNPHGDVDNVSVENVKIEEIYALEVEDGEVRAEVVAHVDYAADFSYEDLGTGFYDKETGEYYMTEYVHGEAGGTCEVLVRFNFSLNQRGQPIVTDLTLQAEVITIQEEDRGDYGMYK